MLITLKNIFQINILWNQTYDTQIDIRLKTQGILKNSWNWLYTFHDLNLK